MEGNDIYDGNEDVDGNFASGRIIIGENLRNAFVTEKMGQTKRKSRAILLSSKKPYDWPSFPPVMRNSKGDLNPGTTKRSRMVVVKTNMFNMANENGADTFQFAASRNAVKYSIDCAYAGRVAEEFRATQECKDAARKWVEITKRFQRERESTQMWQDARNKCSSSSTSPTNQPLAQPIISNSESSGSGDPLNDSDMFTENDGANSSQNQEQTVNTAHPESTISRSASNGSIGEVAVINRKIVQEKENDDEPNIVSSLNQESITFKTVKNAPSKLAISRPVAVKSI